MLSEKKIGPMSSGGGYMCLEQPQPINDRPFMYETISESADYILKATKHRPKIGIICGSGLGGLAELLTDRDVFPYKDIPNFPVSTVPGHAGQLVVGMLGGVCVICMQGRFHYYEGYPLWKCAMPVRVMKLVGIVELIVTNAAGGLNSDYNVGDIMIIKDHINMQGFGGDSPLRGGNDERFGVRFPSMNNAYDRELRRLAMLEVKSLGLQEFIREGIYMMLGGPTYETVAEIRLLGALGVDAVGMSTVHEVIVARHCGLKVFGFSLITNKCVTEYDSPLVANHEEVIECANQRKKDLQNLVCNVVRVMEERRQS